MDKHCFDNLKFTVHPVKFYPEDEEKMKNMTIDERIEYKRKLKAENKYIVLNSNDKEESE